MEHKFAEHMSKFGLSYGTNEEYDFRLKIFMQTEDSINKLNSI